MAGFHWVLHDAEGKDLRTTETFESKQAAEDWMGTEWSKLLDEGAESVSLRSNGDALYRMGLREA